MPLLFLDTNGVVTSSASRGSGTLGRDEFRRTLLQLPNKYRKSHVLSKSTVLCRSMSRDAAFCPAVPEPPHSYFRRLQPLLAIANRLSGTNSTRNESARELNMFYLMEIMLFHSPPLLYESRDGPTIAARPLGSLFEQATFFTDIPNNFLPRGQ